MNIKKYVENHSVDDVTAKMGNSLYKLAIEWFEALEYSGKIRGNGHHAAQSVVAQAQKVLQQRRKD